MGQQLTVTGEQFMVEASFRTDLITRPSTIDVLLYNDSTDSISDTNNVGDISTEPTGSNYSRQSVNLDSTTTPAVTLSENGSNNWEAVAEEVTFDTSDSSQSVDGYGWVANFDASGSTSGNNGDNLILTGALSQSYDLSNVDTLNVSNTGLEQT